jgi:hypothetical protein
VHDADRDRVTGDRDQGSPGSEDPVAAARERARQQVHGIFAATPEEPLRQCPHCGAQRRTRFEHCPACGKSYFVAPPRFSRRTRRALTLLATAIALAALAALVTLLKGAATDSASRQRTRQAAAVAAERRRLSREQAAHHGRAAGVPLPRPGASASARRDARRRMVSSLQATITADARGRVARGEIKAGGVRTTECDPLNPGQRTRDEDDLDQPLGRYSCLAVTQTARRGTVSSHLGVPFVAVIDFRRGTFTWCKDNPVSPADIKSQLAFVRLARECTAARGPAFGSGYLVAPRKR